MGLFGKKKTAALSAEHQKMVDDALAATGFDPSMVAAAGMPQGGVRAQMKAARGMQEQAQRYARLQQSGVDVPGTVLEVRPAGHEQELRLSVEGAAPYEVTVRQAMHESFPLSPGLRVTLRVDPGDRQNVAVWGGDPDAVAAPRTEDPLDALTALADRRDQGLIGEAEYEAERARLLAEM